MVLDGLHITTVDTSVRESLDGTWFSYSVSCCFKYTIVGDIMCFKTLVFCSLLKAFLSLFLPRIPSHWHSLQFCNTQGPKVGLQLTVQQS